MRRSIQLALACVALLLTLPVNSVQAAAFYGVSLNGHRSGSPGSSSLYSINSGTGAGTLIGTDLGYAVNAIAIDPTSGIMYGSTTSWSGAFNGLLRIDPNTGTATQVGAFGSSLWAVLGLTFDSSGNLYGWTDPSADDPVTINKATGAATILGNAGIGTAGQVLAFDSLDNLTLVQYTSIYDINTTSGAATNTGSLSFDPGSGGAAFDFSTGLLWASRDSGQTSDSWIRVSNLAGNSYTDIDTDITYLHAVTWGDTSAIPEPTTLAIWSAFGGLGMMIAARRRRRTA